MTRTFLLIAVAALLPAACVTVPPPDPITIDEIVHLGRGGPESPALVLALETRPLGFPITYQGLRELEDRGAAPEVIDTVVAYSVERRARILAPRYAATYAPYWAPYWAYPWDWQWSFGYGCSSRYRHWP